MGNKVDLSSLVVFQVVAKNGSISKAAKELQYVQSNVTAKMKVLEEELQTDLFYRHSRGVTLTSAGELLLSYSEKILSLVDEAKLAVNNGENPQGSLSIGSMETTAAFRLPSILAAYSKDFQHVEIKLKTSPTAQLIEDVLSFKLEGAFVGGQVDHPELVCLPFVEEELVLVKAAHLKNSAQTKILVFRNGCTYRHQLEKWLELEGKYPVSTMEFGSLDAIIGCVSAGMGISLLPKSVVEGKIAAGELIYENVSEKYREVTTMFVMRRDSFISTAMKEFMRICRIV